MELKLAPAGGFPLRWDGRGSGNPLGHRMAHGGIWSRRCRLLIVGVGSVRAQIQRHSSAPCRPTPHLSVEILETAQGKWLPKSIRGADKTSIVCRSA